MKRTESGKRISRSKRSSIERSKSRRSRSSRFVVCVRNGGYVDLEPLKVYRVRADRKARTLGFFRVVDESGEDYLYPADFFRPIQAPSKLFELVERLA